MRAMEPVARYGYLELLLTQWQSEDCSISGDPLDLAEASALGDRLWEKHSARILRNFEPLLDGRRRNAVCFEEWIEAKRIFEARSESAKRTNTTRSPNAHRAVTDTLASRPADTITGTGTLTETKEQKQKPTPAAFELPAWISFVTWKDFEETRKKLRAPLTDRAKREIIQKLDELRARGHPPEAVLAQSIARGWRGVFDVKEEANAPSKPAKPATNIDGLGSRYLRENGST